MTTNSAVEAELRETLRRQCEQLDRDASELLKIRDICTRLWPAVRHFGLCGADLKYIEAVVELGEWLGVSGSSSGNQAELIAKARMETVDQVAEAVRASNEVLALGGRGLREKLADAIANMGIKR